MRHPSGSLQKKDRSGLFLIVIDRNERESHGLRRETDKKKGLGRSGAEGERGGPASRRRKERRHLYLSGS